MKRDSVFTILYMGVYLFFMTAAFVVGGGPKTFVDFMLLAIGGLLIGILATQNRR
jgi:hypothetical protein